MSKVLPMNQLASVRFSSDGSRHRMRTEDVRLCTILFRGVSGQPHGEASRWVPTSSRRDPTPGHSFLTLEVPAGDARSRDTQLRQRDPPPPRLLFRFPGNTVSRSQAKATEKQVFRKRRRPLLRFHREASAFGVGAPRSGRVSCETLAVFREDGER